jgi:ATP-dependent DNA ligase
MRSNTMETASSSCANARGCACSRAWSDRFPLNSEAARGLRTPSVVIDGEAMVLGVDGVADFDALHARKHDDEVQRCLRPTVDR